MALKVVWQKVRLVDGQTHCVRNATRLLNPWIRSQVHKATWQAITYSTWPTHVKTQQSSPSSELMIVPHTVLFPPIVACPHAHHHPVTHSTFSPSPPHLLLPPISHHSSYMQFVVMFPLLYTLPKSQLTILPDFLIVTSSYSISLHCYLFYYLTTMYTMPIQQSDYRPSFPLHSPSFQPLKSFLSPSGIGSLRVSLSGIIARISSYLNSII